MAQFKIDRKKFFAGLELMRPMLSDATLEMLEVALSRVRNDTDLYHIYEWVNDPDKWMMPMVSIDTFMDSVYFLNIGKRVYPKVRQICRDVIEGKYREGVILAGIGCEAVGTKIIMADGSIKSNDQLKVGDMLMGIDSTPRKIIGLHTGTDKLYKITPIKGESKIVTGNHVLSLERTCKGKVSKYGTWDKKGGQVVNITVNNYLQLSKKMRGILKLYRRGINFEKKFITVDPYFLGLWLGDGTSIRAEITTIDIEIIEWLKQYAGYVGGYIYQNKMAHKIAFNTCNNNPLLDDLRGLGVIKNKHIPFQYKTNDRQTRLQILAGLIDSDGSLGCGYYEFSNKNERLINDVLYLARSLGFAAYKRKRTTKCLGKTFSSYRITILGEIMEIPVKIARKKQLTARKQKKSVLRTGFLVEEYGYGDFIGIELDQDKLYLWDDFTVTHNSGKSFLSQILLCYMAHKLLCMRNPHETYGLARDKNISIINMGTSATQAWEVVFSGITTFIQESPFFQQFRPDMLKTAITFKSKKVTLMSGNSKSNRALGANVFASVLDEAAFYLDNDNRNVAEEIYKSLNRRIVSRFQYDGLLLMISSPRYMDDFIMTRMEESRMMDEYGKLIQSQVYTLQLPTWKVKSIAKADMANKFYFNARQGMIMREPIEELKKTYSVNYVSDTDFSDKYDIWEIPGEYMADFKRDPEFAKRDYGATPSETITGFFPRPEIVRQGFNRERKDAVIAPGQYSFDGYPLRTNYYIHIDLGMNKDGRGDYTGFCMGHFGGYKLDPETDEQQPVYYIDILERIGAGATGEVEIADVRRRIYDLKSAGFAIGLVSLDGFQSRDFMQVLNKRGFATDYLSVDRTIEPYNLLKESFYEKRIDIAYNEILESELIHLELIKGIKVDHPPKHSKDLADAVAGVVFSISQNAPKGLLGAGSLLTTSKGIDIAPALKQHEQYKQREAKMRRLQEYVKRQDDIHNDLKRRGVI